MATFELPILNHSVQLDFSGEVYFYMLNDILTMAQPKYQLGIVFEDPTTNVSLFCSFVVPQNYDSSPVLVIRGIVRETTPAGNLGFGVTMLPVADNEGVDQAYATEDTVEKAIGSYTDEDMLVTEISLSTPTFAVGDTVFTDFFRDESGDTATDCIFILTDLSFKYSDGA
jgi:hypothetical protein